jgi:hypothetical protein
VATQLPIRLPSARLADEPVDQQHQREADLGNTGAAFRAARPAKMSDANF